MICPLCGRDPQEQTPTEEPGIFIEGHACHCVYVNHIRAAVGICCGHELGPWLAAEDEADERRAQRRTQKEIRQ